MGQQAEQRPTANQHHMAHLEAALGLTQFTPMLSIQPVSGNLPSLQPCSVHFLSS